MAPSILEVVGFHQIFFTRTCGSLNLLSLFSHVHVACCWVCPWLRTNIRGSLSRRKYLLLGVSLVVDQHPGVLFNLCETRIQVQMCAVHTCLTQWPLRETLADTLVLWTLRFVAGQIAMTVAFA